MINKIVLKQKFWPLALAVFAGGLSLWPKSHAHGATADSEVYTKAVNEFHEIFQSKGDSKICYKVTKNNPPDPSQADALEKSKPAPRNLVESLQLAAYDAQIKRVREGYQSISIYTLYISGSTKFTIERLCADEWNKGIIKRSYFNKDNVVEITPSAKAVTIRARNSAMHPWLVAQFPALIKVIGINPDGLKSVANGEFRTFIISDKTLPLFFLYNVDANKSLLSSEMMDSLKRKLRVSKFQYSIPLKDTWPTSITSDIYSTDGSFLSREDWKLVSVENLPQGFDFSPVIEKSYRVSDKTGSAITSDEMNRFLTE